MANNKVPRYIVINGKPLTLQDVHELTGLPMTVIHQRLRDKWGDAELFYTPYKHVPKGGFNVEDTI